MRLLLLLCLLVLSLGATPPRVVFLSLDGLGARQLGPVDMPRLYALSRKGWRGETVPPRPSTTFAGHATLATGCLAPAHGLVGNAFLDPQLGWVAHSAQARLLEREPLWVAATRAGVRTAVYHWPAGESTWGAVPAWRQVPFRSGTGEAEAMAFVDQALAEGAGLVMAYFLGSDEAGHVHGPGSPAHRRRLRELDARLGPWLERLSRQENLRLVVAADHGMTRVWRRFHLPTLLEGFPGRAWAHGRSATVHLEDPAQAQAVIGRLRAAGLKAWPSAGDLDHPRAGHVLVQAPPGGWLSTARDAAEATREARSRAGAHGSLEDEPELRATLFYLGAGKGRLGTVSMTRVAPTVAAWLGATWTKAPDGQPLPGATLPR